MNSVFRGPCEQAFWENVFLSVSGGLAADPGIDTTDITHRAAMVADEAVSARRERLGT